MAQGLPYYEKFITNYPTVHQLAEAPEDQVLKDWEGLGYYSRARNMHTASRQIVEERQGNFPSSFEEILALKGVGEYTAAAISSLAFNHPHAVVDGNVFRVLARYLGISTPINSTKGKKQFTSWAGKLLDTKDPGTYNQAIMEFGALQCVPKNPDCDQCPLQKSCVAYATGRVNELPFKERRNYNRLRYFNYILLKNNGKVWLQQRTERDIWSRLYEFYRVETAAEVEVPVVLDQLLDDLQLKNSEMLLEKNSTLKPHKLSHQTIYINVLEVRLKADAGEVLKQSGSWVDEELLTDYALPRPLRVYLDRNQLTLRL